MNQDTIVYIGLGSNLGNKEDNIKKAILLLQEKYKTNQISSLYASEPWGYNSDSHFFNAVICITTNESPISVFNYLKMIESKLGRIKKNTDRYEDRIIDLDILFYGIEIIENEIITIPHKEIHNRRFVLDPLNELAPDFIHPVLKKPIHVLLENCQDTSILEQITYN